MSFVLSVVDLHRNPYSPKTHTPGPLPRGMGYIRVDCTSAKSGSLPRQDNIKYYVIYCIFYILHLGNGLKTPIFENVMLLSTKLQPDPSRPP